MDSNENSESEDRRMERSSEFISLMQAIDGDGSSWSYLSASILSREAEEFGAMWHGCVWSDQKILSKLPRQLLEIRIQLTGANGPVRQPPGTGRGTLLLLVFGSQLTRTLGRANRSHCISSILSVERESIGLKIPMLQAVTIPRRKTPCCASEVLDSYIDRLHRYRRSYV